MRCDVSPLGKFAMSPVFQSLLGFLMRCDCPQSPERTQPIAVSIPAGFSDALRLFLRIRTLPRSGTFQSLLGFLMRCDVIFGSSSFPISMFQSLLGFLMRCDVIDVTFVTKCYLKFQSLLGFLMRCDHPPTHVDTWVSSVSIPAGFSDALRP